MAKFGYRKLFADLEPFYPKRKDLDKLAAIMSGKVGVFLDINENFNLDFVKSADLVESKVKHQIPPGYTYLLQFIAHDITFDEASDRHRREDFPWDIIDSKSLKKLKNLRTPFLNLDSIYGSDIPNNKNEISRSRLFLEKYKLPLLRLGETSESVNTQITTSEKSYPNDLPRGKSSVEALIVDPRNDENLLLAQTQVAFMKFHNALVVSLNVSGKFSYKELFKKAHKLVILYYQTIIITDLLPKIAQESVIKELIEKIECEEPNPGKFGIPLEFSVAAFRFGHSMIRKKYNINKGNPNQDLRDIMAFSGIGMLHNKKQPFIPALLSDWIINWNNFYQLEDKIKDEDMAMPIDTEITTQLLELFPPTENSFGNRANSIAAIDLFRGRRFGLPSGQDVARKFGVEPLSAQQISSLIDSKEIKPYSTIPSEQEKAEVKERLKKVFSKKTPLWFYILAEAEETGNGRLGEVGSRIVVETLLNLIYYSEYSILQDKWEADEVFLLNKTDKSFSMPEMLKFIQETCKLHFEELYPKSFYPKTEKIFDELNPLEKGYQ